MSELSWPHLNTSIWKVQGIASRAQRPLTTALWDNNFPSLRGAMWRNNGSSMRNGSRFDLDDRHLSGEYGHTWGEIKNVMLWLWLRPICRGLLSQCTRACANSTSNPSGYAVGIWLPVSHAPSCIVTTNPSRAGLNPTNIAHNPSCNIIWLYRCNSRTLSKMCMWSPFCDITFSTVVAYFLKASV